MEQDARRRVTDLELQVADYLARLVGQEIHEIDMRSVLTHACGLDAISPDYVERAGRIGVQVVEAMHLAGWEKLKVVGCGSNRASSTVRATPALGES